MQRETFERRRRYSQEVRETLKRGAFSPWFLGPKGVRWALALCSAAIAFGELLSNVVYGELGGDPC